jgi:hypothetical protein
MIGIAKKMLKKSRRIPGYLAAFITITAEYKQKNICLVIKSVKNVKNYLLQHWSDQTIADLMERPFLIDG